jgi:hypothetical protein
MPKATRWKKGRLPAGECNSLRKKPGRQSTRKHADKKHQPETANCSLKRESGIHGDLPGMEQSSTTPGQTKGMVRVRFHRDQTIFPRKDPSIPELPFCCPHPEPI